MFLITSILVSFTLRAQANGPLNNDNVFDYFTTSMFYDKQSNNQVLRMQTMHTGQPLLNEAEELKYGSSIRLPVSCSYNHVSVLLGVSLE